MIKCQQISVPMKTNKFDGNNFCKLTNEVIVTNVKYLLSKATNGKFHLNFCLFKEKLNFMLNDIITFYESVQEVIYYHKNEPFWPKMNRSRFALTSNELFRKYFRKKPIACSAHVCHWKSCWSPRQRNMHSVHW